MFDKQHNMLDQEYLASAVRGRPPPQSSGPPMAQKPDMVKSMLSPPKSLNPTQMATGAMGLDGGEGLKTPEDYIYNLISPNGLF